MPLEGFAVGLKRRNKVGGADGIRTHDLLDAIEARSQLRHGPTGVTTTGFILHELTGSVHDAKVFEAGGNELLPSFCFEDGHEGWCVPLAGIL